MGNIFNHNRPVYKLRTSKSDYWDMHLSQNNLDTELADGLVDKCLSAFIDTNIPECIEDEEAELLDRKNLISLGSYIWDEAASKGIELKNIGYTGTDNGLILFDKDTITEEELDDIRKNSLLTILEDDYKLRLTPVDGNNKIYSYDTEFVTDDNFNVAKLNGGFFQGFFKINNGCNYQILPDKLDGGWTLEFVLKPEDYEQDLGKKILNDVYPDNRGIFFYVGTRAENKWWKLYNKEIGQPEEMAMYDTVIETDNKFITYNRTKTGMRANSSEETDVTQEIVFDKHAQLDNYFIIMNRAKGGYTAKSIKDIMAEESYNYNILADLYRNALAFQVRDDGSVGYKFMVKDCESETGYSIEQEWSYPGMVDKNVWSMITVRVIPIIKYAEDFYNYEERLDYMRLAFYVNGKLVLWSKIMPTLLLRALNDEYSKQEGVPYNVSLGGGTQGLCDVIYGINDTPEDHLFLEKEFGGSFIGKIKVFRFHTCDLNYQEIYHNYLYEINEQPMEDRDYKIYYGTFTFDGLSSNNPVDYDNIVHSLKTASKDVKTLNVPIPVNTRRVVIGVPHIVGGIRAILDANAMTMNIKSAFEKSMLTKKEYDLYIPQLKETVSYDIYVIDYAFYNDIENNYIVNL